MATQPRRRSSSLPRLTTIRRADHLRKDLGAFRLIFSQISCSYSGPMFSRFEPLNFLWSHLWLLARFSLSPLHHAPHPSLPSAVLRHSARRCGFKIQFHRANRPHSTPPAAFSYSPWLSCQLSILRNIDSGSNSKSYTTSTSCVNDVSFPAMES